MALYAVGGKALKDVGFLLDGDALGIWLFELADLIGMHPVPDEPLAIQRYAHWGPAGAPSAVLWIEESSITVHCYPNKGRNYIEVVVHSCKPFPDEDLLRSTIIAKLGLIVGREVDDPGFNWQEISDRIEAELQEVHREIHSETG